MISWCQLCLSHHSAVHQSCLAATALDLQGSIEERVSVFYCLIAGYFYNLKNIFVPLHNVKTIYNKPILTFFFFLAGKSYICCSKESKKVIQSQGIYFPIYTKFFMAQLYVQTLVNILLRAQGLS